MTHLEENLPEAHEFLKSGRFSVQISDQNPFDRVPFDQTYEETVNKDTRQQGAPKASVFVVKSPIAMLASNWINPFSAEQQDLVCLSTGKVATQKIEEDLLCPKAIGQTKIFVHSAWRQIRQSNFTSP